MPEHVRIDYLCRVCASAEPPIETIMLGHAVSTTHERFEDEDTWYATGAGRGSGALDEQITERRDKLTCKRCGHSPVWKHERFVEALRAVYQPGRHEVIKVRM
jgi:hypothetical protein